MPVLALRFFLSRRSSHFFLVSVSFGPGPQILHTVPQTHDGGWAVKDRGNSGSFRTSAPIVGLLASVGSRKQKNDPVGWEEPSSFNINNTLNLITYQVFICEKPVCRFKGSDYQPGSLMSDEIKRV